MHAPPVSPQARVLFLDKHAACGGTVSRHEPYLLTCRFFRCGAIDRTGTLEMGFAAEVLDSLDAVLNCPEPETDFGEICRRRALEILHEANTSGRRVQVLWSGGIDSTVALIALMQAADRLDCRDKLQILLSVESVDEYPDFFHRYLWGKYDIKPVGYPIADYLSPDHIIVTGEHGDQLYGSDFLETYVGNGLAFLPWQDTLPLVLAHHELRAGAADDVTEYLRPLTARCPVDIVTLFDFFWWLNFSLKWQMVSLRIAANSVKPRDVYQATRHFFQSQAFQVWSLFVHQRPHLDSWADYKMPSKEFIYAFTQDAEYKRQKQKERSLRLVFAGEPVRRRPRPLPDQMPMPDLPDLDEPPLNGLLLRSGFELVRTLPA